MNLTIGSLFSGIGGLELGLERAGVGRVVWQCERDPFARRVLEKHWPGAIRFDDILTLSEPPHVDVLCGGFPCTDISTAGHRAGIDGEQSGLWREYVRVAGIVRPRYIVVENVSALLVRGLERVLGDLAALGCDAEWDCLPASAIGAPHRRDRIFVLAYPVGRGSQTGRDEPAGGGPEGRGGVVAYPVSVPREARRSGDSEQGARGRDTDRGVERPDVADSDRSGFGEQRRTVATLAKLVAAQRRRGWSPEPAVGRVANGVPDRVDRLRTLGNAVVPQVAEVIGRRIVEIESAQA